jgi:hypothetical protein
VTIWLSLLVIAALCLCAAICLSRGYTRGWREGYDAGKEERLLVDRRAEHDWWLQAEKGIDAERQKIWESET